VYGRIGELERKLRAGAEKRRQAELAALNSKIAETKAQIDETANRSGMGRRALIYARRELAQLRETLPKLEKQREELLRSAP
jgi:septal ring factor EnvC (AmiA/AmiB activator)